MKPTTSTPKKEDDRMKKKIISLFLAALLTLGCTAAAFAAQTPARYLVTAPYASVYSNTKEPNRLLCTVPQNTYLEAMKEQDGYLLVNVPSQELAGWVKADELTYADNSGQTDITGIFIASMPDKTEYIETEDSFDETGLVVKAKRGGGSETVIEKYTVYTESFSSAGKKKVTVLYRPEGTLAVFTASFTVTVKKIPVTGLIIEKLPKTEYIENTPLDLSGIKVTANYSDGRASRTFSANDISLTDGFTVLVDGNDDLSKLTVGTHTVKIIYRYPDIFCSFKISVKPRTLIGFRLLTYPDNMTVYSLDSVPSLDGLTMKAVYDNGEAFTVLPDECEIECDLSSFKIGNGNYVFVRYGTKEIRLDFTVRLLEEKRLKLTLPQVLTFIVGEKIDLGALKVEVEYTDGSTKEVTDYTLGKYDPLLVEQGQQITVTYGSFSEVFTIYITKYYQRGDVDGNGKITVDDARYALRQAVNLISLSPNSKNYTAADANMDGKVTVDDARLILRAAVGLEKLPLALNK